jgi:hypothetical protein
MKVKINGINKPRMEVSQAQRRICSLAMLSALVVAVVFMLIQENAIAKGLLLGTLFSILNFVLMGKSIPMTLGRPRHMAGMIGLASILFRYLLLAVPMVVGIKSSSFNFIAVVAGIFSVQIVTLFEYILIRPILDGE